MQSSLAKGLKVVFYICLTTVTPFAVSVAQNNATPKSWPYDPSYKPISKQEITHLIDGKRTSQEQEVVISRAALANLLDFAVSEYLDQAKLRRNDAMLQSAFGYAFYLAENSPSSSALYQETHSLGNRYFAVEALNRGAKLAPKDPFPLRALAYAGISKANEVGGLDVDQPSSPPSFKHSLEYLNKAILLAPNDARTYRLLAWGYSFRTKYQDADKSLAAAKKAIQLAPKSSDALYRLALAEFDKKNYKVAYDWLQKSYALRPPEFRYASFLAYYKRMAEQAKKNET